MNKLSLVYWLVSLGSILIATGCNSDSGGPTTDSTPPTISITSPSNNSTVIDSTLIGVAASDNIGVDKVEFYIDGILASTRSTVPWQYNWNVRSLTPNSAHSILAKAYDAASNVGTSPTIAVTVNRTPPPDTSAPTVSVVSPPNNSYVSDNVLIQGNASDNVGVVRVEFYIDGNLSLTKTSTPWEYLWPTQALQILSSHSIHLKAYDLANNVGTSTTTTTYIKMGHRQYNPDGNTVFLMHLNETSGTSLADSSGYNNSGTATGTTSVQGKFGSARNLAGAGNFITVSDAASLRQSQITVEAWVYSSSYASMAWGIIVSKELTSSSFSYRLQMAGSTRRIYFATGINQNNGVTSTTQLQDGNWYHVAGTFDGTTLKVFVNGTLEGSLNQPGSIPYNSDVLYLGRDIDNVGVWNGVIDEVRISNRERSRYEFNLP